MTREEPRKKKVAQHKSKLALPNSSLNREETESAFGFFKFAGQFFAGLFAGHVARLSPASFSPARSPTKRTERASLGLPGASDGKGCQEQVLDPRHL